MRTAWLGAILFLAIAGCKNEQKTATEAEAKPAAEAPKAIEAKTPAAQQAQQAQQAPAVAAGELEFFSIDGMGALKTAIRKGGHLSAGGDEIPGNVTGAWRASGRPDVELAILREGKAGALFLATTEKGALTKVSLGDGFDSYQVRAVGSKLVVVASAEGGSMEPGTSAAYLFAYDAKQDTLVTENKWEGELAHEPAWTTASP